MPHLIWSPPALSDVQRLYRFLALNDTDTAKYAIKTIRAGVKILAHQPEVGLPVEDMLPVFREWPINFGRSGYIVLYRYDGKIATVLAVRHQKEAGYYDKNDKMTVNEKFSTPRQRYQSMMLPERSTLRCLRDVHELSTVLYSAIG